MKKLCRMLVLGLLVASVFGAMLRAEEGPQERDRAGTVRGMFVRLAEREVGERGYLAIVIKPFERDDHVTILVPRWREELTVAARKLREGQKVEIGYVTEAGHKWVKGIETERRRETKELERAEKRKPEQHKMTEHIEKTHARLDELAEAAEHAERQGRYDKADKLRYKAKKIAAEFKEYTRQAGEKKLGEAKERIGQLRDMARQAKQRGNMERARRLWAKAEELEQALKRKFEHWREGGREKQEAKRPWTHLKQRQGELKDILAAHLKQRAGEFKEILAHLEQMEGKLKETLGAHLERMGREFKDLPGHLEEMERELQELRKENTQLKRKLEELALSNRKLRRKAEERIEARETREREQRRKARARELEERREVRKRRESEE